MANWVRYGKYYISGAIAVGGVLWWSRNGDQTIRGEDYANIFEAVQERAVVPYLTGMDLPDWAAANDSSTNSIDSRIQYADILPMANRIRDIVTKTDSTIFWTNEAMTNRSTLAVSLGSYSLTNEVGFLIDQAGTPTYTTNNIYSYTTNVVLDTIATTATRLWNTNSTFEYRMGSGSGYDVMSLTNLPLGNLVFGKGASTGLLSESLPKGAWWPFTRAYSYPWEQWLDVNRGRVTVNMTGSDNISFTNAVFVTTNSPGASFLMHVTDTNKAGYAFCKANAGYGNDSVTFLAIKPPPTNSPLYVQYPNANYMLLNKTLTSSLNYLYVFKRGIAMSNAVTVTCIGTPRQTLVTYDGWNATYCTIGFHTGGAGISVFKCVSANTNVPPIYFGISTTGLVTTNEYFSVSSLIMDSSSVSVTSSVLPSLQAVKDDKRLLMSKLYDFRASMTNLTRTVWIANVSAMTMTNATEYVHSNTNSVWMWREDRTGTADFTPTYNTAYDETTFRTSYLQYNKVETNSNPAAAGTLTTFDFNFSKDGVAEVYGSGNWGSYTAVTGGESEKREYKYYGLNPPYPSLYAVTNGYVKKVKVFAVVEFQNISPNDAYPATDGYYSHSVGGNYIYSGNIGVSNSTLAISQATDTAIDTTIRKYNYADFRGAHYNELSFVNESVLNLVYEVNNPTNRITFDFTPPDFTHSLCSTYRYHFEQSAASSAARTENWSYDYNQHYEVAVTKWIVVVDWKFKNYGGYLFDIENQTVIIRSIVTSGDYVTMVVTASQVPLMPPSLQWKRNIDSGSWSNRSASVTQVAVPAGVTNAATAYEITTTKPDNDQAFFKIIDNSAEY